MKKLLYTALLLAVTLSLPAQQVPILEGYNLNPFVMSPAYAGIYEAKTVFLNYRSDWAGLSTGPSTMNINYNDRFSEKVGIGGRFIYDKTDIFKQTLLLGTYTYEVNVAQDHFINFGLSAGFFRNSIDLSKYYSNPDYVSDQVLIYGLQKSRIKFATDVSALYRYRQAEAGILFSNLMMGTAKYRDADLTYKPFSNYLIHASYNFKIDEKWTVKPMIVFRDGKNVPGQLEISPSVTWNSRLWGDLLYRTGGILGLGFGGEVYRGVLLNYSYNMSTGIALNTFGSHQLTLGIKIPEFIK